ncbi:hypothetical protein OX283_014520 [Flavobacterium sp. SUN052]|uniref:hypothetical protein n=1 Tax=Flavobacterium sp. SUN052 TaxID=3002441 RepID=UPI002DB8A712|nr:hypothetical protein [Flavobacterium sp. SUN052]MEC4005881.1 hypothetical protein [Flavobacterium sp. SUN052]
MKQKYCSNSCRTRAFVVKNKKGLSLPSKEIKKAEANKIEKMSLAGVGNAAVGTLAVNALANLFTSEANKPATKKDIDNLLNKLKQRYYPIFNIPLRQDGAKPYYDIETKNFVYIKNNLP